MHDEGSTLSLYDSRQDDSTRRSSTRLDLPLRHHYQGHCIKGTATRHEIVECGRLSSEHNRITFPVTFCNGYVDRTHPTLREMEEMAWVLRSDPSKRQIGFVEASKLKPKDRYVLADEDW